MATYSRLDVLNAVVADGFVPIFYHRDVETTGESVGGPDFIKAILGPCPWTRVLVTGGVTATQESINAWFKSGVTAVGIGSALIRKEWIETGDYAAITEEASQIMNRVHKAQTS